MSNSDPVQPEELFEHAGFLRALARGLVGDGARADDLVQDTWVAALERPPRERGTLRGWLAQVARRRASNLRRGEAHRSQRELRAARPEAADSAEAAVEQLELARAVSGLVLELREPYRTTIFLRFYKGLRPVDIAHEQGVPVKTVKTRLSRGLDELRNQLDHRPGGRESWAPGLMAFALSGPAAPAVSAGSGALLLGAGITMKKLALAAAVLLLAFVGWRTVLGIVRPARGGSGALPAELAGGVEVPLGPRAEPPAAASAPREPLGEIQEPAPVLTGELLVRMRWADGTAAAQVGIDAQCLEDPAPRTESFLGLTDGGGELLLPDLFAGVVRLYVDRGYRYETQVVAGDRTELEIDLPVGTTVLGRVVDPEGEPVAGAEIFIAGWGLELPAPHPAARSGADGRFRLTGLGRDARLGARAAGFQPSAMIAHRQLPLAEEGDLAAGRDVRELTLTLGAPGGSVSGRVFDPEGRPVGNARVQVGPRGGHIVRLGEGRQGEAAKPVPQLTDAVGEFVYPGDLPTGPQPVHVLARGYPVWSGTVDVRPGERSRIEVQLARPARVVGRVVLADGSPVEGALVRNGLQVGGGWYFEAFPSSIAETDPEGLFALDWIAPGEQELNASASKRARLGKARATVSCVEGQTSEVELVLDTGKTIAGRVVDRDGQPLVGWGVYGNPESPFSGSIYPRSDRTDESGGFLLANLGDCTWAIGVAAPGEFPTPPRARVTGLRPDTQGVEVVVENIKVGRARFIGRLVGADGEIPADVRVVLYEENGSTGTFADFDPTTGVFEGDKPVPGRYELRVSRGQRTLLTSPAFELVAGETRDVGLLSLGTPASLEVVLRDIPEAVLPDLAVRLDRPGHSTLSLEYSEGRFRAESVTAGTWLLRVRSERWWVPETEFELRGGETTRLELSAVQGYEARLSFVLTDLDDAWSSIEIEIRDEEGTLMRRVNARRPEITEGGVVTFGHGLSLPQGHFALDATTDTGTRATGTIVITDPLSARGPHRFVLR